MKCVEVCLSRCSAKAYGVCDAVPSRRRSHATGLGLRFVNKLYAPPPGKDAASCITGPAHDFCCAVIASPGLHVVLFQRHFVAFSHMSDSGLGSESSRLPGHLPVHQQLYRSCDACRASKLRCRSEPQSSTPGACLRCSERRLPCSFSPVATRAKRSGTRRSASQRLGEIEKRVQDLRQQLHKKALEAGSSPARQTGEPDSDPPAASPAPSSANPQLGKSVQRFGAHWTYMSDTKIEQMFRLYFQDRVSLFPKSALSTAPKDHKQLQRKKPLLFLSILVASASMMSGESQVTSALSLTIS
jgi:hypothetical protein